MKQYSFYIDSKHTVWLREYYSVNANSEEEAIQKAKGIFKIESNSRPSTESETLPETFEQMSYEENQNNPTEELIWPTDGRTIVDNTPIEVVRDGKINNILENEK